MIYLTSKPELDVYDRDLMQRVATFLVARGVPDAKTLVIKARGGIVTMQGRVSSMRNRALCLSCCQRVAGVLHVIDELSVEMECRDGSLTQSAR